MNLRRLLLSSSFVVFAACPQPTQPTLSPPPVVARFTATPATAAPGETVTLSWEVTDATRVSIAELAGGTLGGVDDRLTGTIEVAATADDAFYVLTAENERGVRATAVASVQAEGSRELLFAAVPPELPAVGTATLVWSVPGARQVSITSSGMALDLGGQGASGSLVVDPSAASTSYTLTADGQSKTIEVTRAQAITSFTITPPYPRHGDTITISWTTTAATRLTVTSPGFPLIAEVTDPAAVASGSATWTLPSTDVAQDLPLVLRAEGRGPAVERAITLFPNDAAPQLLTVTAPAFVRQSSPFVLSWTSRGADLVRVSVSGTPVYEGVANGSVTLPSPANETTYDLVAVRVRTNQVSAPRSVTVASVGVPALVDFAASPTSIATGGEPVTLSWNVTNARNLTIREVGGAVVHQVTGPTVGTGTLVVYPNRPTTQYELVADNAAGQSASPAQLSVTVQSPARLTFSTLRPVGSTAQVTGTTLDAGTVTLLPVARTSTTDGFVDISLDGTPITFATSDTSNASIDVGTFSTQLFGVAITDLKLSVSTNGWMVFNPIGVSGPSSPGAIGTALQPLAMAVFYADLDTAPGRAYWRVDTVNGERRLIVQWTGVTDGSAGTADLTFQAQVFERGRVVYAYETIDGFTGGVNAGIVNENESAVLMAPATPTPGAVFTFFADATLPQAVPVQDKPIVGAVRLPQGLMRIEGDPRLLPGQLSLSEANPRPGVDGGEWIEVTNASPVALDLAGYELTVDAGARVSFMNPLVVPAGGRVVLAAEAGANDGLTVDATYGTALATRGGALTLSTDGVAVSRMELAQDGGVGRSVRADPFIAGMRFPSGSNHTQLTCPDGTNAYGSNGQFGTPGQAQGRCFPYVLDRDAGVPFIPLAVTGTQLVGGGSASANESVFQVNLTKPVNVFGVPRSSLWVSTNGFIATSSVAATFTNKITPSATAPSAGTIAPFWDDLNGQGVPGSGIFWQEFDPNGTPNDGDEFLLVSWERWRQDTTTVTDLNFQVRFSANGDISYHYGSMTAEGTSTVASGSSATIWLEDPQGRSALAVSANTSGAISSGATIRYVSSP